MKSSEIKIYYFDGWNRRNDTFLSLCQNSTIPSFSSHPKRIEKWNLVMKLIFLELEGPVIE